MPVVATTDRPSFIDPERLYSLRRFIRDSGISYTRIREAGKAGVELPMIRAGKRAFVRRADGIAFIEQLAAMSEVPR